MAGYKVTPPDLADCKSFDTYKTRLKVWELTTPAPKDKHGAIIASTLPNNSKRWRKDLQDKFFENVDGDKLVTEDGLKLVRDFLEDELAEEALYKIVCVWKSLRSVPEGQTR